MKKLFSLKETYFVGVFSSISDRRFAISIVLSNFSFSIADIFFLLKVD